MESVKRDVADSLATIKHGQQTYHIGLWLPEEKQLHLERRVLDEPPAEMFPRIVWIRYANGGMIMPTYKYQDYRFEYLHDGEYIAKDCVVRAVIVCLHWEVNEE